MELKSYDDERILKKVFAKLTGFQREIYEDYLRQYVDDAIEKFDEKGYFPKHLGFDEEYALWRKSHTKDVLKNIYIADPTIFNNLNAKPTKILIRLIDKILVSNENDELFDVLEGVLDLDKASLSDFAYQIKEASLKNIISTIEVLQKRQVAINELREIMETRYNDILETPDLQKIIENNTWLFGPQYTTLGAEEDSFVKIGKRLRDEVKGVDDIEGSDLDFSTDIEGARKQVDLFLARKSRTVDYAGKPIFKCVIIEIKRPSVSLNKKHLQQLDDYAEIIQKYPAFGESDAMRFELILVGRKISNDDVQIAQRKENLKSHAEYGLVSSGAKSKSYVKDWFTIFDEFTLSNSYLLEALNSKLDDLTNVKSVDLVTNLQAAND